MEFKKLSIPTIVIIFIILDFVIIFDYFYFNILVKIIPVNILPFAMIILDFLFFLVIYLLEKKLGGIDTYISKKYDNASNKNIIAFHKKINEKLKSISSNSGLLLGFLIAGLILLINVYFRYFSIFNEVQKISFNFLIIAIIISLFSLYYTFELAETYIDPIFSITEKKNCRKKCQHVYIWGYQGLVFTILFLLLLINIFFLFIASIFYKIVMISLAYYYPKSTT